MRSIVALALLCLLLPAPAADAARKSKLNKNGLLTVVEPKHREPANAHPFVNVVVLFGRLLDFTPADPTTFKARIGRDDVTSLFTPTFDGNGNQIGVRAELPAERVKLGRRPRNAIRFSVEAFRFPGTKGPRIRDVDRIRFGAVETVNQPCTARADADMQVILPGIPVQFTGSAGSSDPDRDELTYLWDFGDGEAPSSDPDPQHVYDQPTGDVLVRLTVSDGQASCTSDLTLESVPKLDEGKTPGVFFVDSEDGLEFAAVALGATRSKTVVIRNTDTIETSQVKLRFASTNPAFQFSAPDMTLGPGEEQELTITFAPQAADHQHARIAFVANATNRQSVSFLAHGHGGDAPGAGPTLAAAPYFYTEVAIGLLGLGTFGVMPDGTKFFADNGVHTCVVPGNGLGTGDFCVVDQDCQANGGTCNATSTCPSGPNTGQTCAVPADCPGSFCPSYTLFDPVDLCSDGKGLYLISDEGSFTEPDPAAETERAVTVIRLDMDPNGTVTGRKILDRTTTETAHIACDGFPSGQGGQVYVPEFHNVPDAGSCFRSEREALVKIAKGSGATSVVTGRMDAYEGLGECDDLDPVQQLEMTSDGGKMFAAFESGGLWQIRPNPIYFSADITDTFQVHPDGTVLFAATTESGSTGLVNLYRIRPEDVQSGPLPFSALLPCASFTVPNNGGRTVVIGFAASRSAQGPNDATGLVSFVSTAPGLSQSINNRLIVRGTAAFTAPAGTSTCSVEKLVNAEALELAF